VFEVLRGAAELKELAQAEGRVRAFVELIERYGPRLSRRGFSAAARELCEEIGLFEEARKGAQSPRAQARKVEAIEGLLRQLVEFEKRAEQKAAEAALLMPPLSSEDEPDGDGEDAFADGLSGYLARLALDSREAEGDLGDTITLTTLHGAKGLEWRAVFLCGLEEGLLPHSGRGFDDAGAEAPAADGAINLEEERRLCYVGMTRARDRLYLTHCRERLRRGTPQPRTPSRFLDDLPKALVDLIDLCGPQTEVAQELKDEKARNFFAKMDALLGGPPKEG
jgi:DNA helicase-2/ATP-dependent DNA helicase PcrA